MSVSRWSFISRRAVCFGAAVLMEFGIVDAQVPPAMSFDAPVSRIESNSVNYSSSKDWPFSASTSADPGGSAHPADAGGQPENRAGGGGWHYAWVGGGGFNAPIGNDSPYITWGGNIMGGGGLRFSQRLSLLGEFSFFDDKLPGAFIAAGGGQTGNAHILGLTVDPIFDLFPSRTNSAYVVGGGGYYHKSTNFNVLEDTTFTGTRFM